MAVAMDYDGYDPNNAKQMKELVDELKAMAGQALRHETLYVSTKPATYVDIKEDNNKKKCKNCKGTGTVVARNTGKFKHQTTQVECHICKGKGKIK